MIEKPRPMHNDFETVLRFLRRRGIWIVVCVVIATAAAVEYAKSQTKEYTASAGLLFRQSQVADQLFGSTVLAPSSDPARAAATNVQLVGLDVVAARTAAILGQGLTGGAVSSKIQVQGGGQSDLVTVAATDRKPALAARLANTFSQQFVNFRQAADRASVLNALNVVTAQLAGPGLSGPQRTDLSDRAQQLRILAALQTGGVELVEPAHKPTSPSSPRVAREGALGGALGLILGLIVALLLHRFDRRIRDLSELKEAYGLPLLGTIPKSRSLRASKDGSTLPRVEAEAFQMLRTAVRYAKVDRDIRSVLVASASPSEGKSTIAWNLAIAAAAAGPVGAAADHSSRVLLIEADFHRPSIAAAHNLLPEPGLGDLIVDGLPLVKVIQSVPASFASADDIGPMLDVIPAGAVLANPSGLLQSSAAIEVLSMLTRLYGLVVIDTPPSAVIADAIPLMRRVGAVVLVGRIGVTRRDAVRRLMEQLTNVEARLLGLVANDVPMSARGYGYYGHREPYGSESNGHPRDGETGRRSRFPVGRGSR